MTKRIVFEGIWGSNMPKFTNKFITESNFQFDTVKVGVAAPPFNGIKSWTYALTQNMENWRESNGITLHERSVWACYDYARALAKTDELAQAEIDLFKDMTLGMEELNPLPDLIVYFHSIPAAAQNNLETEDSVCKVIGEEGLMEVSKALIDWFERMQSMGVKVVEIAPAVNDFDKWFTYAEPIVLKAIREVTDGD